MTCKPGSGSALKRTVKNIANAEESCDTSSMIMQQQQYKKTI